MDTTLVVVTRVVACCNGWELHFPPGICVAVTLGQISEMVLLSAS